MSTEFPSGGIGDEMKALLSAYATGTLSDAERKRLFEQALGNQELFDELMEAETMRAAMEGPLAKRALRNALEEDAEEGTEESSLHFDLEVAAAPLRSAKVATIVTERKSRRGVWVALAACLVVGTVGLYTYFGKAQKPVNVEMAQAPRPVSVEAPPADSGAVVAPPAASPAQAVQPRSRPESVRQDQPPVAESKVKAKDEGARQEAPLPAPPTPPVVTIAEAKKVNEELATAAPRANEPASTAPGAPAPNADMVMALRDAEKKESREKSALGASMRAQGARAVGGNVAPGSVASGVVALPAVARVVGRRLEVQPGMVGQLYVFLSEGARFRRLPGLAPVSIVAGGARSFDLPEGVAGTLFVLLAPQRDAELDRLAEPHEGALPVRNWTRLQFN